MKVNTYTRSGGKNEILTYIVSLPARERIEATLAFSKIERDGLKALEVLNTRQLEKKLWEIKLSKNRFMYVVADEDNLYVVNACRKQKGKAEKFELEKARKRVRELEEKLGKKFL